MMDITEHLQILMVKNWVDTSIMYRSYKLIVFPELTDDKIWWGKNEA